MSTRLLYVEDDETLAFLTVDQLETQGYTVVHCTDGKSAIEAFKSDDFDLCILDVMLPKMDGFSLAEEIRKRNESIPIIFLTAKSLKEDRITGLRLGADDYITKPYSIEELLLKIQVFLRRRNIEEQSPDEQYRIGAFHFDYPNLHLHIPGNDDTEQVLTQREADLLRFFAQNKNQVVKRSDILLQIWGEDDYFMGRSLDVFISRLRKYLAPDEKVELENIHGIGFRLRV